VTEADFSRRGFLAKGVALGAMPLVGLANVDDALAAPPPTVYDVTTFGAQGDGTADDSNAIQAAIDAANSRGGGTVVFPAGTFRVTRALTIYSQIVFRGAGTRATVIRKSPGGGAYPIVKSPAYDPPTGEPTPIFSWSLQNISFDGNRDAGALGNGVQVYASGYSIFNVTIYNCEGRGLWVSCSRPSWPTSGCTTAPRAGSTGTGPRTRNGSTSSSTSAGRPPATRRHAGSKCTTGATASASRTDTCGD